MEQEQVYSHDLSINIRFTHSIIHVLHMRRIGERNKKVAFALHIFATHCPEDGATLPRDNRET